jgi:hypothetical protein
MNSLRSPRPPRRFLTLLAAAALALPLAAQTTNLVSIGPDGRLTYAATADGDVVPDFSAVGYKNGEEPIPTIATVLTLEAIPGDNREAIQAAIEKLEALPLQKNGFRGALLLKAGLYEVSDTLRVKAGGVVIRGDCLQFHGAGGITLDDSTRRRVEGRYVPYGSKKLTLTSAAGYAVGDWVRVEFQYNQAWIELMRMGLPHMWDKGARPGREDESWKVQGCRHSAERQILAIKGNTVTLDAPITDPVDERYNTVEIARIQSAARIENCGVENIRFSSYFASDLDVNHGWKAVSFDHLKNGWAINIDAYYFGYSSVSCEDGAIFVTVDNCKNFDPKSELGGGNRYSFNNNGQRNLFQNCFSSGGGRHCFVTGSWTPGPNVFYNCKTVGARSDSGPHHRWSTGHLYDNVSTDRDIRVRNRLLSGSGHGWTGGQIMLWNCVTRDHCIQDPPGNYTNWAVGCIGEMTTDRPPEPNVIPESPGKPIVAIPSLYIAQLNERLGTKRQHVPFK